MSRGVLAERLAEAPPARLGRDVGGRVVGAADPDGDVLLCGDPRELLDQRDVAGGGEPEGPRPLREGARRFGDAERRAGAVVVARIGDEEDGRAQPPASAISCTALSQVAIVRGSVFSRLMNWTMCRFVRASVVPGETSAGGPPAKGLTPKTGSSLTVPPGPIASDGPTISPAFSSSVICATRSSTRSAHRAAPVLVDVERPVLVEVLEEQAVDLQHRHHARADHGLDRALPFAPRPAAAKEQAKTQKATVVRREHSLERIMSKLPVVRISRLAHSLTSGRRRPSGRNSTRRTARARGTGRGNRPVYARTAGACRSSPAGSPAGRAST